MAYKDEISKTEIPTFVELYEIKYNTEVLYLTSYITDIQIEDKVYKSAVMMREEFRTEMNEKQDVVINIVIREEAFQEIIGMDYPNYTIIIKRYFPESGILKTIFLGVVEGIGIKEKVMSVKARDMLSSFSKSVPTLVFSTSCNRTIYDPYCGLRKSDYKVEAVVTEANQGKNLISSVFDNYDDGWFDYGFVEYDKWKRLISKHVADTLELHMPFPVSVQNRLVRVYPGCDLSAKTCKEKFNNIQNFLGFPYMPAKNPVIWGV